MAFVTVTIDARKRLVTDIPFVRYEMTARREGTKYYVAAVHQRGGSTTVVDVRRHGALRHAPRSSQAYLDIREAAEAAIRAEIRSQDGGGHG